MINRELLEAAAKASGLQWSNDPEITHDGLWITAPADKINTYWNPLAHNGDAFLLSVTLGITVTPYPVYGHDKHSVVAKRYQSGDLTRERNPTEVVEVYGDNPAAATRRAIVRCAAAIGSIKGQTENLTTVYD
jgi:hypothetical protein